MIRFIKESDPCNQYDNFDLVVSTDNGDIRWSELQELFYYFLRGCGYNVTREDLGMEE